MIYLKLFLNFFVIGTLSFGGGYGMISLIRDTVLSNNWLTENEFVNLIAVSGSIAVNIATFIGSSQGGIPGALAATFGVVLPSFFIILLIAAILKNLMKYASVNAFLSGVRPCVAAMILATAVQMALPTFVGFSMHTQAQTQTFHPDIRSIGVFLILITIHFLYKKFQKRTPSPILMILLSAGLGILLWK